MCIVLEAYSIIVFAVESIIYLHTPPLGDVPGNTSVSEVFQQCRRFQLEDLHIFKGWLLDERHRLVWLFNRHTHFFGDELRLSDEVGGVTQFSARVKMSPPAPLPKSNHTPFRGLTWNEGFLSLRYGA
nr:hypothetical protein [uncultured Muribaculum sp.]